MSETRNYAGIALSAIETDTLPMPAPLEEWVATGVYKKYYCPIPNPLFPPVWIANGEHDAWDVVQAWVRRFRYLQGLNPASHSEKGLELQSMSSCAGLHELVVIRDAEKREIGKNAARWVALADIRWTALQQLAKTLKEAALRNDWCEVYEEECNDFLQSIDSSLRDEVREALMRTKKVEITREVPYVVWVKESVYDVEVPYDFEASDEDPRDLCDYFPEVPEDEIALLKANSRITRIEEVSDFDKVDAGPQNYKSSDL